MPENGFVIVDCHCLCRFPLPLGSICEHQVVPLNIANFLKRQPETAKSFSYCYVAHIKPIFLYNIVKIPHKKLAALLVYIVFSHINFIT